MSLESKGAIRLDIQPEKVAGARRGLNDKINNTKFRWTHTELKDRPTMDELIANSELVYLRDQLNKLNH